jgi:glucose/arabinose dehydrogenase
MGELDEKITEAAEHARGGALNSLVAALVALAATAMAIDNVKDGNIGQAMAQAQAKAVDTWSYYQAKSTKENLAEATLDQLQTLRALNMPPDNAVAVDKRIETYQASVARYEKEKAAIKTEAEGYEQEYTALNQRDDQFDLSDAAFSLAIALLGVSVLTQRKWLVGMAGVFLAVGFVFGAAGFFNWPLHPDRLMSWLS